MPNNANASVAIAVRMNFAALKHHLNDCRYCNLFLPKIRFKVNQAKKCIRKKAENGSKKANIWYYLISNHSRDAHCFFSFSIRVYEWSKWCWNCRINAITGIALMQKDTIETIASIQPSIIACSLCNRSFEMETISLKCVCCWFLVRVFFFLPRWQEERIM